MDFKKKADFGYLGLVILAFFPLFPFFLMTLSIFTYIGLAIASGLFNDKNDTTRLSKGIIAFSLLFYLLLIIRGLFNEHPFEEVQYFRASLSLLVFPITWMISKNRITSKQRKNILRCFTMSTFILAIYILFYSIYISAIRHEEFLIFYDQIEFIHVHPNYTSIYFIASIIILYLELKNSNLRLKIIYCAMITLFIILLLFLATKIVLLTLFILIALEIIRKNRTITKRDLSILLICVSFIVVAGIYIKPLNKKLSEVASLDEFVLPYGQFPTSFQVRLGIYHCSIPIIKKNWIVGTGAETLENEINQCYNKFNNHDKLVYNTHNYYFFLLVF